MAKRFAATEIWDEDWFLDLPVEYKLFWFYMLSTCDHAGLFRVNMRSFRGNVDPNLTPTKALDLFNLDKQRIRVIRNSLWLIEDFFVFQYGPVLNRKNRMHESVFKVYTSHNIDLRSIRGLIEVKEGVKDKDMDKDIIIQEGVQGEINKWNFRPSEKEMDIPLPEIKAGAATELYYHTNKIRLQPSQINDLWIVFKRQNFTGEKSYPTIQDTYSHFINWIKTQKVNGTHGKSDSVIKLGTSAARIKAAKEF